MTDELDTALVARCLKGELSAFDALLLRYQKPLYNSCLRMLHDPEDARDVLQTVFLKAYEKLDTFDPERRFFSWIYRMMINESLNWLERRRPSQTLTEDPVSSRVSPEEAYIRDEQDAWIQEALMKLSPDNRAAVVLKYFGELSYKELAWVLEIPEKTVKSRLYSARRQMAEVIAAHGITS